jgi:hypothetical protein
MASFFAGLLAFFKSITSLSTILNIVDGWLKQLLPTPTEKIESDKEKLDREIDKNDQTGRPT